MEATVGPAGDRQVHAVPRFGHVPALDGLRGVAIASVVLYHAWPQLFPGGFLGVDLFFCLSGFLITTLLLEEHERHGRVSIRSFIVRRARRLLPVALTAIVLVEVILLILGSPDRDALGGLFAAFYAENLAHYLDPPVIQQFGHFWSLSQEEQFYLVWPPLLALALALKVRRQWIMGALVALAGAVVVHRMLLADDWWRIYYAPDTRSDGLLLGCALAFARRTHWIRPRRIWLVVAVLAAAAYLAEMLTIGLDETVGMYGFTVANLAAIGFLAAIVADPNGLATRALTVRPLCWLGLISYSLYIWQPLTVSLGGAHGWQIVISSLIIATVSYRYIERPLRRGRAPGTRRARSLDSRWRTAFERAAPRWLLPRVSESPS